MDKKAIILEDLLHSSHYPEYHYVHPFWLFLRAFPRLN